MNDKFIKIALDAGLLNYVDNETPRRYFINGHADIEEVEEFAKLIVKECIAQNVRTSQTMKENGLTDCCSPHQYNFEINELFGLSPK